MHSKRARFHCAYQHAMKTSKESHDF